MSPPGPVFFLSYARTRPGSAASQGTALIDANKEVKKLFTDLTIRVQQLLPLKAGEEAGFMDTRMEAGHQWSEELLYNLSRCRVFVALLSAGYLERSEWCPREWYLFANRQVQQQSGETSPYGVTAIVPVLWTPVEEPLPPVVSKIQRFGPGPGVKGKYVKLYEAEGVLGMLNLKKAAYKAVVWSLARQIRDIYTTLDVTPLDGASFDGLPRSFSDGE